MFSTLGLVESIIAGEVSTWSWVTLFIPPRAPTIAGSSSLCGRYGGRRNHHYPQMLLQNSVDSDPFSAPSRRVAARSVTRTQQASKATGRDTSKSRPPASPFLRGSGRVSWSRARRLLRGDCLRSHRTVNHTDTDRLFRTSRGLRCACWFRKTPLRCFEQPAIQ